MKAIGLLVLVVVVLFGVFLYHSDPVGFYKGSGQVAASLFLGALIIGGLWLAGKIFGG